MYTLIFSKDADKALRRMPRTIALNIASTIKELAGKPHEMRNAKKLTNHPGYRVRIGDWRVVYTIHDNELLIHGISVKTRGEVYT